MTTSVDTATAHLPLTTMAFEILLAVASNASTGYEVMLAIEKRTAGSLSPNPGTLYRAVDRLAGEGLITVRKGPAGTTARRSLTISPLGQRVLTAESDRLAGQIAAARALAHGTDQAPS